MLLFGKTSTSPTRAVLAWLGVTSLAAALLAVRPACAQDGTGISTGGIDPALMIPTGHWGRATSFGIGVLGDWQYGLDHDWELTGRAGLVFHFPKDDFRTWELPILAGAKYGFGRRGERPYVAGELGFTWLGWSSETMSPLTGHKVKDSGSDLYVSMTLGGGYEMERWDLRGAIFVVDIGHASDAMGLLLTTGYAFSEF